MAHMLRHFLCAEHEAPNLIEDIKNLFGGFHKIVAQPAFLFLFLAILFLKFWMLGLKRLMLFLAPYRIGVRDMVRLK